MMLKHFNRTVQKAQLRSPLLDAYRGLAVVLMIIFHFCWDLREFGYIDYRLNDSFWVIFRSIILTLFLTAIGWSSYLSQQNHTRTDARFRFLLRQGQLFTAASVISLATYIAFPERWIYFGILHFIVIASFLHYPVARYPLLSTAIGCVILVTYQFTDWLFFPEFRSYLLNVWHLPRQTLDIIYPFPWLACVFLGPILGYLKLHQIPLTANVFLWLKWFGNHALSIYLTHQVVLYALVYGVYWLFSKI